MCLIFVPQARGEAMQAASDLVDSGMVSVIGVSQEKVKEALVWEIAARGCVLCLFYLTRSSPCFSFDSDALCHCFFSQVYTLDNVFLDSSPIFLFPSYFSCFRHAVLMI